MVEVKVKKLSKQAVLPKYAREGDAAFDLRSMEEKILKSGEKEIFRTGLSIAVPEGHCGLIWDRSGLAAKHGVHTMAGVIDSGYRGELMIVLRNTGKDDFLVERNMRIAQMLIQPVITAKLSEVEEMDRTERDKKGFGSTGLS